MGSDYAMENRSFIPRPSFAEWQDDDLVIYKDYPVNGYEEVWRYANPPLNEPALVSLIKTQVSDIPSKPVPFDERIRRVLNKHYGNNIATPEAIIQIKEIFNGK